MNIGYLEKQTPSEIFGDSGGTKAFADSIDAYHGLSLTLTPAELLAVEKLVSLTTQTAFAICVRYLTQDELGRRDSVKAEALGEFQSRTIREASAEIYK